MYERDEPVSLEREDEVRERRALQPGRKKGPLVVRGPVHYERAAERKWKRCADPSILEGVGGDNSERGQSVVRHYGRLSNSGRKQNVVVESKQSLRETLEERGIRSYQNYFCHRWCRPLRSVSSTID